MLKKLTTFSMLTLIITEPRRGENNYISFYS